MWAGALSNREQYYNVLAPAGSRGILFTPQPPHEGGVSREPCTAAQAWNTAQFNIMLYQFMSAFFFSAVVEPVALWHARHRMRDAADAERAVWCIEACMLGYDIMHSCAGVAVVGLGAVVPGFEWSRVDAAAAFNTWSAVLLGVMRVFWMCGVGREFAARAKSD